MLPAMALPGSPSMPAVMTSLGLITSNAARTQSEVSWLSGPGPGTNPARKILATVSSSRHPKNLVCLSGFSPIHPFSASDSSESIAPESSAWRGASTPKDTGFAVGSGIGGLSGVALGAAVGLSVGAWVETRASVDAGSGVTGLGADVAAPAGAGMVATSPPGVGVCSPQASRAARITRIADTAVSVLLSLIRGLTIPPPGLPLLFGAGLAPGLIWYGLVAAVPAQPELLGLLSSLTCRLPSGLPAFGALPSEPFVLLPACERGRFGT